MAFPTTRDELNQVITELIRVRIPDKEVGDIGKLETFFPIWDRFFAGYNEFTAEFVALKTELETIRGQLSEAFPKLQEGVSKGISDLESRASAANATVASSVTSLEKRDREISDKLKDTFKKIDSQIEEISLSASTVQVMQDGIHGVVAKQSQDMIGMKFDIERYHGECHGHHRVFRAVQPGSC